MKIGIFTDSYKPYTSGVVTSITTFKRELEQLGHQFFIFAPNYPNYVESEEGGIPLLFCSRTYQS
ncbi:MAG: hypothetical protein ACOX0Q_06825 [Syntrophomonadaceae bacterium]